MVATISPVRTQRVALSCTFCGRVTYVMVDPSDLERLVSGALIQDAFPYLSDDERELMISNTCGTCFDKIFED